MGLHLDQLILTEFKNYHYQPIQCHPHINCFVGNNGMGKTNLLDAIYYLCMGKSYFGQTDQYLSNHEADFFRLEGRFTIHDLPEKIVVKAPAGQRKTLERNDVAYTRLSDHVGLIPVVMAAPDDTQLVLDGSEVRRRFIDNTLSQLDNHYLDQLLLYNQVLKQRNALLKQWLESRTFQPDLLTAYDRQLTGPGQYIFEKRTIFLEQFIPILAQSHHLISGQLESVTCEYKSPLQKASMADLLQANLEKDRFTGRTTAGIHRDDLEFMLNEQSTRRFASQGQIKSFLLGLKLAQYQILKQQKDYPPLLLLDDIFDKLDNDRVRQLLTMLLEGDYGQLFITDTDPDRIVDIIRNTGKEASRFYIKNGTATLL